MNGAVVATAAAAGGSLLLGLAAVPALLLGAGSACTAAATAPAAWSVPVSAPKSVPISALASVASSASRSASSRAPAVPAQAAPRVTGYDAGQVANAAVIVAVGARLGVPVRGWVIAMAVALQESSLRVLDHGDSAGPDSRGLFQQRAAWGPVGERMDPAGSARLFYTGGRAGQPGLLDIDGWQAMPLTVAAQAVQRSGLPDAYAAREADATALVTAITHAGGGPRWVCAGVAGSAGAQAVAYARAQLGLPYQWAGDGPARGDAGFDCSGLTLAAYASAGVDLPRTAQTQYDTGPRLPGGAPLLPGDLVFFGTPGRVHHVGIYVGGSQMIDAPHTGAVVRVEDYRWADYLGATRPAPP